MLIRLLVHDIHEHVSPNLAKRNGHQVVAPAWKAPVITRKALEKQVSPGRPIFATPRPSFAPQQPQAAKYGELSKLGGIIPSGIAFRSGLSDYHGRAEVKLKARS